MDMNQNATVVAESYNLLVAGAHSELLVCNRPPYFAPPDRLNPEVLNALRRGVAARVLYETSHWSDPSAESFRAAMEVYHDAGVVGRLVHDLPVKLAVADRRTALFTKSNAPVPDSSYSGVRLVGEPAKAACQADFFEELWERSEPLTR